MIESLHHRPWHYLLLLALAGALFFLNLGGATLWDIDEGRNADCALEMMRADNWIIPTFNGQLRAHKPALLYWLQIFSYMLFGVNEFAARFPSALAALVTVLAVYELARSMFGRTTGLFAGVIVAATPMLCGAARFANPDSLLNCCTVLTLATFWIGLAERRWWWFVLLGAFSGLAVLAKGPVGLVLPTAVNFLFLLWERRLAIMWDRRWLLASTAFTFTALPWYIWVGLETHGEFLYGFLWQHNVQRGMSAMEAHDGFPGFYLVVLLVGTAPWSIFLLASLWFACWSAIRSPWRKFENVWASARDDDGDRPAAYRMLLCWIGVYVLFFSLAATKLPNYVLPTVAPCAILLARLLERWRTGSIRLPAWLQVSAVTCLGLIGVGLGLGLVLASLGQDSLFPGGGYADLKMWALVGIAPLVAALVGAWFIRQGQVGRFIFALSLSAVLMLAPLAAYASGLFNRYKAPRLLVEQAELVQPGRDIRIGCFQIDHLPSLNFYAQRNIEQLENGEDAARFLQYSVPVYLILPAETWERFATTHGGSARIVARQFDLYHNQEVVVVTNR
ncbi:MAG TPA: glycosyltransferase family 39 protein [Gemmataceae bacterium]|nr:glycosyltransferase family 39 protein [Gemmataceae bacterium]